MKFILIAFLISCSSGRDFQIIAHRGAPGYLPEHTLEGVSLAHSWDIDYIEPDIVISKDNKAIVMHDIHIDTTTNVASVFPKKHRSDGRYYAVDFTLAQLKKLTLNERIDLKTRERVFMTRFPLYQSNFQIPTLDEYIELIKGLNKTRKKDIGIYPELKSPEFHSQERKDIAKIVVETLNKYDLNKPEAKVYIQCFYLPTLKRLKNELNVKVPLIFLIAENSWKESSLDYDLYRTEEGIKEIAEVADGIGPYLKYVYLHIDDENKTSGLTELAHKYNLKVHPYTHREDALPKDFKNSEELFEFLYEDIKVDGIFTDFGDKAKKYIEELR